MDTSFHLVREMLETGDVIANLDIDAIRSWSSHIRSRKILCTGEGSSRILPSKKARYDALRYGYKEQIQSEGSTQAEEYDLSEWAVLAASNSGRTKEVVRLVSRLRSEGHDQLLAVTAGEQSPLEEAAGATYHLQSGKELAVAATKTVVEQALVYDLAFRMKNDRQLPDMPALSLAFTEALDREIETRLVDAVAGAGTIYWAGRNTGVAEELTLKTNEITRKSADYLEGTYAVHGIEEIMHADDVVILIRPFPEEIAKFSEVLVEGVGLHVLAIDTEPTEFPTILVPDCGQDSPYVELAAGWSLLVHAGLSLGVNLDKPERARKVGNEVTD